MKGVIAYYRAAQRTLFVFDQDALSRGIGAGVYPVKLKPKGLRATLTVADSSTGETARGESATRATADVVYRRAPHSFVGKDPELGDVRLIANKKKHDVAESIGSCSDVGRRAVVRAYTYFGGDGDQSGNETFIVNCRIYNYDVNDCSRGYSGYNDQTSTWALSWQAWPNP